MQRKTKSLSAFIFFIVSPLIFLLFFQNCGQKLQSELTLSTFHSPSNSSQSFVENGGLPRLQVQDQKRKEE